VIVPADLHPEWITGLNALTDDPDDPLPTEDLEHADAVVTGCALGIAATGTIILDSGANQGRRALTLVPDHHICVVSADQIVNTVPQAFAAHCQLEPTLLADVMIRGDEPWLGRNVLSRSLIHAAAVVVAPVISVQTAKRSAITCRYSAADSRCRRGRKCGEITLNADRNCCACRIDLKRFNARSRCRVG
jgi:hypothetical protein